MTKSLRNRKGFTLIELLVVVLILGILVAVALPAYISSTQTAKQNAADGNARALSTSIQAIGVKTGSYPSTGLADTNVVADLGGSIPDNPCSASTGADGYTFTGGGSKTATVQAKSDACSGFTGKTYTLKL